MRVITLMAIFLVWLIVAGVRAYSKFKSLMGWLLNRAYILFLLAVLVGLLAPLFSDRAANWLSVKAEMPAGTDTYYSVGAGAAAVLLVAAVIAAERVMSSVFEIKWPRWLFVTSISLPFFTVIVLGIAVSDALDALLHCHRVHFGQSTERLVCGTYRQESYLQEGVFFGWILLLLQVIVVFINPLGKFMSSHEFAQYLNDRSRSRAGRRDAAAR